MYVAARLGAPLRDQSHGLSRDPGRAATSSRLPTSPPVVSNASSTHARRIIEQPCTPVVVYLSEQARSSMLNVTG
jgi:hypothetical protein